MGIDKHNSKTVLDLFCGAGGLSLGFRSQGCKILGVDNNSFVAKVYEKNKTGKVLLKDLTTDCISGRHEIVIGGPPCRPWSAVNLRKRGENHEDYGLVGIFFDQIAEIGPDAFLMENVPQLVSDAAYREHIEAARNGGYSVEFQRIKYSNYGSASGRTRLITVGFKDPNIEAAQFFDKLSLKKATASTVRQAIGKYEKMNMGSYPDHDWPNLKTIHKYEAYYKTGKFGWYKLHYDRPAPSFGNVMKTYILHPRANQNGVPLRVISVREAMEIIDFPSDFAFPKGMPLSMRYQMVADAVSPTVSEKLAETMTAML